jgi:hypothetical protein
MRNLKVGLVLVLCLLWAEAVWAGQVAAVPQTGQTNCYVPFTSAEPLSCDGTGQDGELQSGVNLPNPRFTDKGDGTIKDNLTGLIWLKNAHCVIDLNWQNALEFVKNLNDGKIITPQIDCGDTSGRRGNSQTDWRLPNIREMLSLIDFAFFSPAISNAAGTERATPGDPFTALQQTVYWTSTTSTGVTDHAWVVDITDGIIGFDLKSMLHPVIAVRGGR